MQPVEPCSELIAIEPAEFFDVAEEGRMGTVNPMRLLHRKHHLHELVFLDATHRLFDPSTTGPVWSAPP